MLDCIWFLLLLLGRGCLEHLIRQTFLYRFEITIGQPSLDGKEDTESGVKLIPEGLERQFGDIPAGVL